MANKIWPQALIAFGALSLLLSGCARTAEGAAETVSLFPRSVVETEPVERKDWNDAASFAGYYGALEAPAEEMPVLGGDERTALDALKEFDVAIIHSARLFSDTQAKSHIEELKNAGTWVIAYLSIGEDDSLHTADGQGENGYASYYIYEDGKPKQNGSWGSYFVDAGNPVWQEAVLDRAREILDFGVDGLFLDTLDTVDVVGDTLDGMADLVRRLRNELPVGTKLVPNRGFTVFPRISQYVDGVMFESFSTTYDGASGRFVRRDESDMEYNRTVACDIINRVRQDNYMPVFCLEYLNREEYAAMLQDVYDAARVYDFIPYATYSRALDVCPCPDATPQVEKIGEGGVDDEQIG